MKSKELNSVSDWIKKLPPEQRKRVYFALFSLAVVWIFAVWGVVQLAPNNWHSRAIPYDCSYWIRVWNYHPGCSYSPANSVEVYKPPFAMDFGCTLTYGSVIKASNIGDNVKFVTPGSVPAKELQERKILNFNDPRLRGIFFEKDKIIVYNDKELQVRPYIVCYNHTRYIALVLIGK